MLEAEIIEISGLRLSSKGKGMKKYEMKKPRILFVVKPLDGKTRDNLKTLRKTAIRRFSQRAMCSVVAFISSCISSGYVFHQIFQTAGPNDPPLWREISRGSSALLLSLLLGCTGGIAVYYFFPKLMSLWLDMTRSQEDGCDR
jgi:hypothetical protein